MKIITRATRGIELLLLGLALVFATTGQAKEAPANPVAEHVAIPVTAQRQMDLSVFVPAAKAKAVIFLSHGGGSSVDVMHPIIGRLLAEGFAVLAPLHTDSATLPPEKRENLQAAFGSRVADMTATAAYARQRFAGLPLGAFGYSYGSLFTMIGGGAVDYAVPAKIPEMKAVLSFSSPGNIPGLMIPGKAFANLTVPTMMVTGTKDVVPGFVTDPAAHLAAFEGAPAGGRYAIIVDGADHEFIRATDPRFDAVWTLAMDFYKAHLLGDKGAEARFEATEFPSGIELRRR
jgi:alpha-beta hydrolase superfamily lysophospholipase